MKTRYRQLILAASAIFVSTIITVIILEVMLHIAARMFPQAEAVLFPQKHSAVPRELPDAELGIRRNPQLPGHDANGFRNVVIPDTADVVAIGDSHTYGTGVASDQAWPHVLEKLSHCRVYSMAYGGYGPLQYAVLAQQAVRFKPRLMLIGIYFGNDFYDNWQMYIRNPSEYTVPKELLNNALRSERHNPLWRDVEEFFRMGKADAESEDTSLRYFLSQKSSLWGFARAIKVRLFPPRDSVLNDEFRVAVAALTPKQLEYASIFKGTDWRTILTSRYREAVENSDDPRIEVGFWLTQWAIQNIDQLAKRNSIATIFVLLPTKESVFVDKVKRIEEHNYFSKLTNEEYKYRQYLIDYLKENGFSYVDLAPSLRAMVQQPYFGTADGHPNAIGQKEIATRLLEHVGSCKH